MRQKEQGRGEEIDALGEHHDGAAVIAVGDVTGEEGEEQKRGDLNEAYVAQDERRVGFSVEIPAHCDGEHLEAEVREEAAGEKEAVVAQAEGDVGVQIRAYTRCVVTVE